MIVGGKRGLWWGLWRGQCCYDPGPGSGVVRLVTSMYYMSIDMSLRCGGYFTDGHRSKVLIRAVVTP